MPIKSLPGDIEKCLNSILNIFLETWCDQKIAYILSDVFPVFTFYFYLFDYIVFCTWNGVITG